MPRGKETVTVQPQVTGDRLRGPDGPAPDPWDLTGCIVIPRAGQEADGGFIGLSGYSIYYFGTAAAPPHTAQVVVRGETQDITGVPQDFRPMKNVVIFQTEETS